MKILINCSNLRVGGGLQVAHSFIYELSKFSGHKYTVVLSKELSCLFKDKTTFPPNFIFHIYNIPNSLLKSIMGKNIFLDRLVRSSDSEVVFSIFGPTYWKPHVRHICGYAKPQYIYKESPFFSQISILSKIKLRMKEIIQLHAFNTQCDELISENLNVTNLLISFFPNKKLYTITNFYNQIFDHRNEWDFSLTFPPFNGITLLTIAVNYPHKNLRIIPKVISYLKNNKPNFKFRFVLTLDENDFLLSDDIKKHILFIGRVTINQCPYLYEQCNFMFLPTLLECFSASYPEAMKMEKPILTSDLDFAHGLCGEAAVYFNPISPEDIGNKIYLLANSIEKQKALMEKGKQRLLTFDNYENRTTKYLNIITQNASTHSRP